MLQTPKQEIRSIVRYYESMKEVIDNIDESQLNKLLTLIHRMYTTPIYELFELVSPYEDLLLKRREIQSEIEEQVVKNRQLSSELSYSEGVKEINRLHSII
jgi:hypothetical protein